MSSGLQSQTQKTPVDAGVLFVHFLALSYKAKSKYGVEHGMACKYCPTRDMSDNGYSTS